MGEQPVGVKRIEPQRRGDIEHAGRSMTESFLLLFAAGIMFAAAVPNPKEVTLNWLRLAGIIALALLALSIYFFLHSGQPRVAQAFILYALVGTAILAQLAFVQISFRQTQRLCAFLAFVTGILLPALALPNWASAVTATAGIAAVVGLALMDMLLGHAYLTASRMTIHPFLRLNLALAAVILYRILFSIPLALFLLSRRPIEFFWDRYGIFLGTRWLVGLLVPGIFVYMAHDCIKRRATQSATGILYVAGLLLFIGELIALYLLRETGLPF